ncbi:hypothetical protein [Streptomyces purpurogeneiscleroticus]|uniref:hypothetical protein n=1 Tax=Streptomyces purpurogeneiscleroticus TaxID=68259 RepID=UPI0035587EEF
MTRGGGADGGPAERRPGAFARLPGGWWRTAGTALAGTAAVGLLMAGCDATGDGVRSEGSASNSPVPSQARSATPTPSPSSSVAYQKVDARALLRKDPKVGADVKKTLAKPCTADEYPIDVTYASLTGGKRADVIINVMTCADSVGIGSYVYRKGAKGYENVFSNEQPPVYAGVSKGELEITKQTYDTGDAVCCPTGEDVMTYRWAKHRFSEYSRYHTDYSKTVDGAETSATPSED